MSQLRVASLVADGARGVVVLEIPTHHGDAVVTVAEEWEARHARLWHCRVFVFDPSPILAALDVA